MTPIQFNKLVRNAFGAVLCDRGFVVSKRCTFYRKAGGDVYHFIIPDLGRHGTWYDIKVFPASPRLDPLFAERFPDDIGFPTDSWSYLSESGVGLKRQEFNCKSESNFVNRFEKSVRRLLSEVAIEYLDQFRTIDDIIPFIKHPFFLALALHQTGRIEDARPLLQEQFERLAAIKSEDPAITARREYIRSLLDQ